MARRFSFRTALCLWIAATVSAVCVSPYLEALMPRLDQAASRLRVPTFVVILLSVAQSAMLCHFSADLVLHVGAPMLQPWLLGLSR